MGLVRRASVGLCGRERSAGHGMGRKVVAHTAVLALLAAGFVGLSVTPASASFCAYSLGDLSLQCGWDGGLGGGGFTNNNANSDVVTNTAAHSGTQSWRYSGSYNSPGAGTPFTPNVATVGAPNAVAAENSPITPAGDQSVISFAFKAVAPGDGSQINVYEGSYDRTQREGPSVYLQTASAGTVHIFAFRLSSTNSCANQDFPQVDLVSVPSGTWHTVKMTTTYPNITSADLSTYGSTTYVFDEGTSAALTVADQNTAWVHQYDHCNGSAYSPGGSAKWSNSFNDYPTHQGFYIDDLSMKVISTAAHQMVGSFATSFEAAPLTQAPLSVNVTSPAQNGSTQTLTTTGGSGDGSVTYDVGSSTACTVTGNQLKITSASGTCQVTATKAADDVFNAITSSPASVAVISVLAASVTAGLVATPSFTG